MHVRKLPVRQGLVWCRDAVNLGARNPRAIFGATLLLMASMYVAMLVIGVVATPAQAGAQLSPIVYLLFLVLFIAMMSLIPVLIGGLMHVIREVEAGRPAKPADLYAPFHSGRASKVAMLGLVQIAFAIVGGVLMVALAGAEQWKDYVEVMRSAMGGTVPVVPHPEKLVLLVLVQLIYNYFTYAAMLFAIPLVLFSGASVVEAVRDALRASVSNVGPNLLASILFSAGVFTSLVVALLIAYAVAGAGSLVHPLIGAMLGFVVMMAWGMALLVVLVGGAYFAWRDSFEGDTTQPPPFHGIEA